MATAVIQTAPPQAAPAMSTSSGTQAPAQGEFDQALKNAGSPDTSQNPAPSSSAPPKASAPPPGGPPPESGQASRGAANTGSNIPSQKPDSDSQNGPTLAIQVFGDPLPSGIYTPSQIVFGDPLPEGWLQGGSNSFSTTGKNGLPAVNLTGGKSKRQAPSGASQTALSLQTASLAAAFAQNNSSAQASAAPKASAPKVNPLSQVSSAIEGGQAGSLKNLIASTTSIAPSASAVTSPQIAGPSSASNVAPTAPSAIQTATSNADLGNSLEKAVISVSNPAPTANQDLAPVAPTVDAPKLENQAVESSVSTVASQRTTSAEVSPTSYATPSSIQPVAQTTANSTTTSGPATQTVITASAVQASQGSTSAHGNAQNQAVIPGSSSAANNSFANSQVQSTANAQGSAVATQADSASPSPVAASNIETPASVQAAITQTSTQQQSPDNLAVVSEASHQSQATQAPVTQTSSNRAANQPTTNQPATNQQGQTIQATTTQQASDNQTQAKADQNGGDSFRDFTGSKNSSTSTSVKETASDAKLAVAAPQTMTAPATETSAPQAKLDSVSSASAVRQVANQLQSIPLSKPNSTVQIQLTPAGLGTVHITVKGSGQSVSASLVATNEAVRAALSESKSVLSNAIEQKGFSVSELTVHSAAVAQTAQSNHSSGDLPRRDQQQQPTNTNSNQTGQSGSQGQSQGQNSSQAPRFLSNTFDSSVDLDINQSVSLTTDQSIDLSI